MEKINRKKSSGISSRKTFSRIGVLGGVFLGIVLLFLSGCQKKDVRVFLIGDSTMSFYDTSELSEKYGGKNYPRRGWGMELAQFFDNRVTIKNKAVSGRSSKNFRTQGFWDKVKMEMRKGDYLIIQFGHNDRTKKDPKRFTEPNGEFKDNLRNYAQEAMEVGVYPVIATSIVRREFDENGTLIDTHGDYISAARDVAKELKIPLVDLNLLTSEYVQEMGVEDSKKFFLHIEPGAFKKLPEGLQDDTHLSIMGAREVSRLFVKGLGSTESKLKDYILKK